MVTPARPIGPPGQAVWDEWSDRVINPNAELLTLAETTDERALLRRLVIKDGVPADRQALRVLDALLAEQRDAVKRAAAWKTYASEART
jgi:hypothetical protein